ncbi:MAG TPA: tRNA (adenosine(37)-N6)-threonylcarbamoyltransferase complex dimerization subunit type 1 TsaB [Thermoanaerobaculia bacterium]|nr:tRNA (adenosine(37)-N6)-threonylcarbamoyltransferase complex dimerization subunit type 1 TsaB [Thermoanaerobaculia bacterium]
MTGAGAAGRTLLLDTSGPYTTAAVAEGGTLLEASSVREPPLTHLHEGVRGLMAGLGLRVADLARIAVVTGPGSWTGLNIGVTAAKTLAQVLGVPLVPLSSLDALVADLEWTEGPVVALLDAKRGNVYRAAYEAGEDGRPRLPGPETEVVPVPERGAAIRAAPGAPLAVEYGAAFRERLEALGGPARLLARDHLSPEGLLRSYLQATATAPPLTGDDALTLSPRYLQRMV